VIFIIFLVPIGKPLTETFPLDSSTALYKSDLFCALQFLSINMAVFPECYKLLRLNIPDEVCFNNFPAKFHQALTRRPTIAYIDEMSWHCVMLWQQEI
jgi:hypothetical protein